MSNNPLGERGSTFHTRHRTALSKRHLSQENNPELSLQKIITIPSDSWIPSAPTSYLLDSVF